MAEKEEKKHRQEVERAAAAAEGGHPEPADEPDRKGPAAETADSSADASKPGTFPVVGIGASAGGIEALESFFENVPEQGGLAFVVITHTDPKHASLLPSIVRRKTKISVKQVEEGMRLEVDTVYLPPSDRDPVIEKETFRLNKRPEKQVMHMPVDRFFRSLAEARGERAAGVILSGTGTDGTHGLRAVKEKSGLGMVQEPETAKHGGMPTSAIEAGLADYRLAPSEMPRQLIDYFRKAPAIRPVPDKKGTKGGEPPNQILAFLANRTRHDFSQYKNGTLSRRIARRIAVTRCRDAAEYLRFLHRDSGEVRNLFQDLLIGVTNFFRDPEAWNFLEKKAIEGLIRNRKATESLRVWVPGCATGEEAFTVAIVVKESMDACNVSRNVQVFGTDIDSKAIEKARSGQYLQNIAADVNPDRLKRFFVKEGDHYRVKREVRETVVFAEQNILRDPPFSDLDLLVCRNLLIYLTAEAQSRLIPLFHYTLKKGGVLFLGNSETVGRHAELFEPLSKTYSIYRKKETTMRPPITFPTGKIGPGHSAERENPAEGDGDEEHPSMAQAVQSVLLEEFAPAAVVVNDGGEIVYTQGRTGRYLELTEGKPNLNITDMAREGLRFSLLAAIRRAREENATVREEGIRVKTNGDHQMIDLVVKAFDRPPLRDALMLVFEPRPRPTEKAETAEDENGKPNDRARIETLEHELMRVRQDFRSAMEELETSNEELRSSNEEMQSANEELQSTNEELESSREELQSLNEELSTVNSELQSKMEELEEAYAAVNHVLNSTRIAIVFLDSELCVTRFTRQATRLVNLIETDVGRPLGHISNNLGHTDLVGKARQVLKTLVPIEDEVMTDDGHWYRMNIMIHRKEEHVIDGVVLTFVNIDEQKQAQQEIEQIGRRSLQAAQRFAESIVDTVREALLVLDEKIRVVTANRRFYEQFETDRGKTEGRRLFDLGEGQWDTPELRELLQETLEKHQAFEDFRVEHSFPDAGIRKMLLNARPLIEESGENRILLAIEDVTDRLPTTRD